MAVRSTRKHTAAPSSAAPVVRPVPASTVVTADELKEALTWRFHITPAKVMVCRHIDATELLLMGIVPAHLHNVLLEKGVGGAIGEDLAMRPDLRPVVEDYAVRIAIDPPVIARAPEGAEQPLEPAGSIGVWRLPLALLARLFAEGTTRAMEVRSLPPMFPRSTGAPVDGPALPGESVRPGPAPVDSATPH